MTGSSGMLPGGDWQSLAKYHQSFQAGQSFHVLLMQPKWQAQRNNLKSLRMLVTMREEMRVDLEGGKKKRQTSPFGCLYHRPIQKRVEITQTSREQRGKINTPIERDFKPFIHASLYLRIANNEVEIC